MASLPKFLVIFAIVILPSRALSQVPEASEQETGTQPAQTSAVPPSEAEARADGLCCGRSCSAVGCCPCAGPARSTLLETIFFFGGPFTNGSMGDTARATDADYDGNCVIGLGYQRY